MKMEQPENTVKDAPGLAYDCIYYTWCDIIGKSRCKLIPGKHVHKSSVTLDPGMF